MSQNTPTPNNDGATLLSVEQAAERLSVSRSFLDKRRVYGGGPHYVRLSARKIAYRADDLDRWLNERRQQSTSQAAA